MYRTAFRMLFVLLAAAGLLVNAGCHRNKGASLAEGLEVFDPMSSVDLEYRLVPGDVVEITYLFRPELLAQNGYVYVFDVDDEFSVEFLYDSEFNFQRKVRLDGRVSLPVIGEVMLAGQTPEWLASKISEAYGDILRESKASISILQAGRKEDELKEAITTQTGRQREILVRPDGYLSAPIINDVAAEGLTIPELYTVMNERYQEVYPNLETSVQLKRISERGVYVAGEVARPGNYPIFGSVTPLQAISLGGGVLPTGNLKRVIVITPGPNREPIRQEVDLTLMLKHGDPTDSIPLRANSIVYVPRTWVAEGGQFVDQYINKLLMFQGYSLGFTYELRR